jgi:hypothetical protein
MLEVDPERDARFWLGLYEIELAPHVRELCTPGSTSFDLGSESGFYALVFARRGGGRALAVEANPTTSERLRRNVAANPGLAPLIEVLNTRVAMETSETTVSLDELAYRTGGFVPDLVKLDVEGFEVKAIRGAERLLSERMPHLIVETHDEDLDAACRELLEEHGYTVEPVEPRRWLPEVRTASFNRWLVARGRPSA